MTIKDIARECGCGLGTVSRVLNNHPDVSEETREKVLAVVNKHGFVLNTLASRLKTQNSRTIVIFEKGISNLMLNSILSVIQKKLEKLPYNISVVVFDEEENEAKIANRVYYEQKPIGMIFLGGNPEWFSEDFARIKVPSVLISNEVESDELQLLSSVSIDNFKAAQEASSFLVKNGHKKIGVLGGKMDNSVITKKRYSGFLSVMKENQIEFDFDTQYETSKYSFEGGMTSVQKLIEKCPDITAIFAMSDAMALGACRKLRDMNYKVPEQISIIGFDGLSISDYFCPRLATIKQDETALAEKGLEILLNNIEREKTVIKKIIPYKLIEGESVKNIKDD